MQNRHDSVCGSQIPGTGRDPNLRWGGAHIGGEELARMESIDEKRGEAGCKPPCPPSKGLCGKPTIINNVDTLIWGGRKNAEQRDGYPLSRA